MKPISLTRGLFVTVDDEDYDRVMAAGPWFAHKVKTKSGWYAARDIPHPATQGKRVQQGMHRFLLGLDVDDKRHSDHRDGDGLNNQSHNLRIATYTQNNQNKGTSSLNTSGFKGVSWDGRGDKWRAQIRVEGKLISLGSYTDNREAHLAYCEAALSLHGEFGNTGLPAPYDRPATAVLMYRYRFTYPNIAALASRAVGVLFPTHAQERPRPASRLSARTQSSPRSPAVRPSLFDQSSRWAFRKTVVQSLEVSAAVPARGRSVPLGRKVSR